jgi:hypothetical protein
MQAAATLKAKLPMLSGLRSSLAHAKNVVTGARMLPDTMLDAAPSKHTVKREGCAPVVIHQWEHPHGGPGVFLDILTARKEQLSQQVSGAMDGSGLAGIMSEIGIVDAAVATLGALPMIISDDSAVGAACHQ